MQIVLLILVIVVAVVLFVRMQMRGREERQHDGMHNARIGDRLRALNQNMQQYAVMTEELLTQTPDEALLEAVLSNMWAKMAPDLSDAPQVVPYLSRERQAIYALYAVTGGIKQDGFGGLRAGADAMWIPAAIDALDVLAMPHSATLLREASEKTDADSYAEPYLEAFNTEEGKDRMVQYIRGHAQGFVDRV